MTIITARSLARGVLSHSAVACLWGVVIGFAVVACGG